MSFYESSEIILVGAGNIAYSITKGFINQGNIQPKRIKVFAPSNNNLPKFNEMGCFTTTSYDDLQSQTAQHKVVFLCVKPSVFNSQYQDILPHFRGFNYTIISVMAGITLNQIKQSYIITCPDTCIPNFARIMISTACSIGHGICAISFDQPDPQCPFVIKEHDFLSLLSPLGYCKIIPESQIDVSCGLGGSGIAFMYNVIQAMADGGVKMGLPRQTSIEFSAHTAMAAAKMIIENKKHPIELRDQVTSPTGTTIHGLHAYEKAGVSAGLIDAVEAATKRAHEFGCSQLNK